MCNIDKCFYCGGPIYECNCGGLFNGNLHNADSNEILHNAENLPDVEKHYMDIPRARMKRDSVFIGMADLMRGRSACWRKQVGAIIVKDNRPISTGYNGPFTGRPHCTQNSCKGANCDISIHAEANAIAFAARNGVSTEGCTLYVSLSPCINCAKLIIAAGITKVVYSEEYRDRSGVELLGNANVSVEKM